MAGAAERSHSAGRAAEKALAEVEARLAAEAARHQAEAARVGGLRAAHRRANDEWRRHASELQSLRDEYEEVDRIRLDLERRITEAERLITEGHARTPEEAVAALADDDTAESLERRAGLVSRRLGLLGRVNQVAAEEYAALQERHDFLAREMDDVRASRRDLERVILEVDRRIVEVFDQAFREVAEEFAVVFAHLFPEGEGKLVITDPGNLLETGVEIEARPGRKRVKRLSLLSGGERSLTALAFLFAIFRARPSPFYLLDEVEAALDDVNLVRFLGLVREFASSSQVLLVTHQKRTMEAADVLYGVSMGGGGASAIIAERFEPSTPGDVAAVTR
jgi:chromosome segregation protein